MKTAQETWQQTIERIPSIPVPQIIDSKPINKGKFLELSQKTIEYPNGMIRPYEGCSRITTKEIISVLAKTREDVLILIAEYRPLIAPYWNISLPAGLVDSRYTPEETCRKELLEETGYIWQETHFLLNTAPSPGKSDEIVSEYFMPNVSPSSGGQKLEPTEIIEVLRVPLSELDMLMRHVSSCTKQFVVDAKVDQAIAQARRLEFL